MRFTTLLSAGFLALASAQTTGNTPTTTDAATAAANSQQAAIIACLAACKDGDVNCTSKCIAVPNPDASDANATNKCVAECPKGNGTATDNLNYANCVDACIGKYYYTTTGAGGVGAQPTKVAGTGGVSASQSGSKPTGTGTGTNGEQASGSGTGTGAAATTTAKAGAPRGLAVAGRTAGIVAFLGALLAL